MQNNQTLFLPQCVIITGASSGIGKAFAYEIAKHGSTACLILIARRKTELEKIQTDIQSRFPSLKVIIKTCDLTEFSERQALCSDLLQTFKPTLLINNAGMGDWGDFANVDRISIQRQIALNQTCLVDLTYRLLKARTLKEILNVGSLASFQAIPSMAIYAATKSFVQSWSRALHHELRAQGITVTLVSPGGTRTEFIDKANLGHAAKKADKIMQTPEQVAQIALRALKQRRIEVIPGWVNVLSAWLARFLPKVWVERSAQRLYGKQIKEIDDVKGK